MSVRYNPPGLSGHNVEVVSYGNQAPYGYAPNQEGEAGAVPWGRYIEALKRHVLLILGIVGAGTAAGFVVARRVQPTYDVQSTVWIAASSSNQTGPIRPQQLLPATSWIELLRSYSIIEPVVRALRLNIATRQPADSIFFTQFESLPALRPGAYLLTADSTKHYTLSTVKGPVLEKGVVGDSIGRKLGFGWAPEARLLRPGMSLTFWVSTPRNTSMALLSSLRAAMPDDGQFLTVTLSGSDANRTARTLNAWVQQFVTSSGDLKKRNLLEFKKILGDQLAVAESQLRNAEAEFERFRESTITLPSGGAAAQPDPIVTGFFQEQSTLTEIQAERVALEQLLADARGGPVNPQAFLMFPAILNNAPQLRAAIDELSSRQAALRSEKQFLTDANPRVKQLTATLHTLESETIPQIVQNVLASLRTRERNMNLQLQSQSAELRAIPARTIEQSRLTRQVAASENLYSALKSRYEEVSLAEAQTSPDLSILDYAVAPSHPNSNDAPRLMLLAIIASIGLAGAIALFHDRIDRRFRYPEQATKELGLTIAGTVPRLRPNRDGELQVDLMSQVVESFRTLRLAIRYEYPPDCPIVLAVSSPSSSDGKSLVSSNLALAFASAGHKTLLIDGDVRRGTLHTTFDLQVTPGLVEYLSNGLGVDAVVRSTATENLFLVPRGARSSRAPELLVSEKMNALIQVARNKFDVVIIDSPPFIAGVDAYALGAVAGNILVVLRQGVSDRKLAAAKLSILDRLPIRVLGSVINGVSNGGLYRYYGTDYPHDGAVTSPVGTLATPRGLVVSA
jgi:succinoglycan biosynthesis transport protein ExoP